MFGLAYLVFFVVYLLVSVAAVRGAIGYARKNGKSAKRWGWGAAFVMYSIVFWDFIPTVAVHQYYCAKDSGFWVYKTLDQWKAENPGVMEGLVYDKTTPDSREGDDESHIDTNVLNQRFSWVTEKQNMVPFLSIYRWRSQVIDISNGEAVARWVDFSSGKGRDYLKFWMKAASCPNGTANRNDLFSFADELIKMTDLTKRSVK